MIIFLNLENLKHIIEKENSSMFNVHDTKMFCS